jgi:hypothetical protein
LDGRGVRPPVPNPKRRLIATNDGFAEGLQLDKVVEPQLLNLIAVMAF